jgi:glutathione S-transferase
VGIQDVMVEKKKDVDTSGEGSNMMGAPMLKDGDMWIGQTPAIVSHLARKFDMLPEDPALIWVCDKCLNDCQDILADLTRNNGSKMWDEYAEFEDMINGRFKRWLQILEANMAKYGSGGFFCGSKISYADLMLVACLGNMARALGPKIRAKIKEFAPNVHDAVTNLIASNTEIDAHYKSLPESPYCGGQIEASIRKCIEQMP